MTKRRGRHVEEQRRYRARLREKAKDGNAAPRGAPETRVVVQSLAVAVRALAARIRSAPASTSDDVKAMYSDLLQTAFRHLREQGFDPAESSRRLTLYAGRRTEPERRRKPASKPPLASPTS